MPSSRARTVCGIGGDRTQFVRRRFAADVVQLHPRLAVIKIGVNNTGDLDEWDPAKRRPAGAIEEEVVDDVTAVVDIARAAAIPAAVCSILPINIASRTTTAERNALIVRINDRLRGMAHSAGAVYVNYHAHLVGEDGRTLRAELADDGLHPHVLGYEIMARVLLETLERAGIDAIRAR